MPAAFVLQGCLDVIAQPAAFAAATSYWVLDVSPPAVSFDLEPSMAYPVRVQLRQGDGLQETDPEVRRRLARERYAEHGMALARTYRAGVKMSSRQRLGMVDDMWELAWQAATRSPAALDFASPTGEVERKSCCFIFTLPGTHECAGCPRLAGAAR